MSIPMPDWTPAKLPTFGVLEGRYVRLEPLDPGKHGDSLWEALEGPESDPSVYDFIYYGPFENRGAFDEWLAKKALSCNPNSYLTYSVVNKASGKPEGFAGYSNIDPNNGTIEIGRVFASCMHRSPRSTEVSYLLLKEAFKLGFRRVESFTANANEQATASVRRLGFTKEGVFRQKDVFKGKAHDVACFAILSSEWPAVQCALEQWLSDENQSNGKQLKSLATFMSECHVASP